MVFEIANDLDECWSKLMEYFSFYLRGKIDYQHRHPDTNQLLFETKIHFFNLNVDESIYYFQHEDYFYFGLGTEISDFVNMESISKFSSHLNFNLKVNTAMMFAQKNSRIFFIMPIKCDLLSDKEYCSLIEKNEIITIEDQLYINFGELKRVIDILKNMRNFMFHSSVDLNINSYLELKSVSILYKYSKDPRFCHSCNNLISKSFKDNHPISQITDKHQTFCSKCFSLRVMDYFLSTVPLEFKKKHNLQSLAKNDGTFKFYLKLFNYYGLFNTVDILPENMGNFHFTPKKMKINLNKYGNILKTLKMINKLTVMHHDNMDRISPFEKKLFKNDLSYDDGKRIINKLENDAFSGFYYNNTLILRKHVESRIDQYINELKSKSYTDIFKITNELNKLTLGIDGNLNNQYLDILPDFNLREDLGWEIRDMLINRIDNGLINDYDIKEQFNDFITEMVVNRLDKIFTKKEYYIGGNSIHIKAILNQDTMNNFIKSLNSVKQYFNIDNLILFRLDYEFFKIILDINILEDKNNLNLILQDYDFKEFLLDVGDSN